MQTLHQRHSSLARRREVADNLNGSDLANEVTAAIGRSRTDNRTFLRMGYDSVAVLVTCSAGLVGLYFLR